MMSADVPAGATVAPEIRTVAGARVFPGARPVVGTTVASGAGVAPGVSIVAGARVFPGARAVMGARVAPGVGLAPGAAVTVIGKRHAKGGNDTANRRQGGLYRGALHQRYFLEPRSVWTSKTKL